MPKPIRQIRVEGDVAFIPLTQGYEAVIDAVDVPLVDGFNWTIIKPKRSNGDTRTIYVKRTARCAGAFKTIFLHRLLMSPPEGLFVDHIDGNGLNNVRSNLRIATNSQNQQNQRMSPRNLSGVKGVSWVAKREKWEVKLKLRGKTIYIGQFSEIQDAAAASKAARDKLHGEFAHA